jgi:hypothetical protein
MNGGWGLVNSMEMGWAEFPDVDPGIDPGIDSGIDPGVAVGCG